MALVRLLYFCAAYHNLNVCIAHIPGVCNDIADSLSRFQMDRFRKLRSPTSKYHTRQHPCLASAELHAHLVQCRYHGVAASSRRTYQSGLNAFVTFCARFNISHLPTSSLTLQYFCADVSQHISYKTLKVYLAGIRLLHIEHGFPDPTDDSLLELVCRGIRRQQGDHQRTRLPITINHLRTLKNQLRVSQYSLLEQRMLWALFTLAFYGFLRISEYTTLHWSDITVSENELSIKLRTSIQDRSISTWTHHLPTCHQFIYMPDTCISTLF